MGLAIVACQGRKFVAEVLTEFEMIWSTKCFLVLLLVSVHQVHPFAIDDVPEEELVATQTVDVVADETVAESELEQYDNEDVDSEDTPPQLPPDIRYLKDIQEEQLNDPAKAAKKTPARKKPAKKVAPKKATKRKPAKKVAKKVPKKAPPKAKPQKTTRPKKDTLPKGATDEDLPVIVIDPWDSASRPTSSPATKKHPTTKIPLNKTIAFTTKTKESSNATHLDETYEEVELERRGLITECVSLTVGSSGHNTRTVTLDSKYKCPTTVNKQNWLGSDTWPDVFEVRQSGSDVIVKRKDYSGGWGMHLRIRCCNPIAAKMNQCVAKASCNTFLTAENKGNLEKLQASIGFVGSIADTLAEKEVRKGMHVFSKKLIKIGAKLAPFLSALGPMGDLLGAFFPSTEETLLNEIIDTLKNEFKVVNERFDKVFLKFEDIEALIEDQHMRTRYHEGIDRIKHATQLMELFMNAGKTTIAGFKTQIQNIQGKAEIEMQANRIYMKIMDGEFMNILLRSEKSNRHRVQERMLAQYNFVQKGVKFYLLWLELKREQEPTYTKAFQAAEARRWSTKLQSARNKLAQLDAEKFTNGWGGRWKGELEAEVNKGGNSADKANRVYNLLSGKYDWMDWEVLVYNNVRGWDNHAISYCGGYLKFSYGNVNIVVTHIDGNKALHSEAAAHNLMKSAKTQNSYRYCRTSWFGFCSSWGTRYYNHNNAKTCFDSLIPRVGDCNAYSLRAVIKSSANVQLRSASDRCSTHNRDGLFMLLCD